MPTRRDAQHPSRRTQPGVSGRKHRSWDSPRLGRTLHAWRDELCAHFDHPDVSNGPTENLNLKIKNTKRTARGYRNFAHYRPRLLLNHGQIRNDPLTSRIRTRRPRFAA